MENVKAMIIPMHLYVALSKDEEGKSIDQMIYRDTSESHLKVVKRIFRYLVGTTNFNLFYKKNQDFRLVGYCDAGYARDIIERKSRGGGCHFIGQCLVSWKSKKQNSIALSTTKIEFVSVANDYSSFEQNIPILCDNTSVTNLSKNPIQHSKAKHIEIRHYFIRYYVQKCAFDIKFINTYHQWVDDRDPTNKAKNNLRDARGSMTRSKTKMRKQSLQDLSLEIKESLE
ncbi:Copia protein, partial [Mucuna pruriens]